MIYSIKQLSEISGINKITLRSWEERYGFLVAQRSDTNIRKYSTEQLICAINTSALLKEGLKISTIAKKSPAQINTLIESKFQSSDSCNEEIYISRIIQSAVLHKRDIFDTTIYKGFQHLGLVEFYSTVMFVSLQKIGLIWSVNSKVVDHERFVFGLLQDKINDITNEIITKKFSKDIWLLFVMAPYIFLDRDEGHFVSLNNTVGMVTEASVDHEKNWSS